MAIFHHEQVRHEIINKNCSDGHCSPPPPPFDHAKITTFSPFNIAVIAVIAAALLLVGFYTVAANYCLPFNSSRRRRSTADEDTAEMASPSKGLDEALIDRIPVYRYKPGEGYMLDGSDCSVCLAEFREDDGVRLLPKCNHAFHLRCIDTWLKSHSICPLCRANIVCPPEPGDAICAPAVVAGSTSRTEDGASGDESKAVLGNAIAIEMSSI